MRSLTVFRKTLGDLSDPRLLAAYLVGFLGVGWFLSLGFANNEFPDDVASLPLADQTAHLFASYVTVSFLWGAGIPILVVGAVLAANTLARELETGTLRIVLSKPVRRWEVFVGLLAGVVVFTVLVGLASLLLLGAVLYTMSGVRAAAIEGGLFAAVPPTLVFVGFVALLMAAVGATLAVVTASRLRTALGGLVVPALFFGVMVVRLMSDRFYEDYALYLVDVNYHLGHVFYLAHESVGDGLPVDARVQLSLFAGIFEVPAGDEDGLPQSVDLVAHVEPVTSLVALSVLVVGLSAVALYRFQRLDV